MTTHKNDNTFDITNGNFITNLFHLLLNIKFNQERNNIIDNVNKNFKNDLERNNELARLRNLGKI